MKSYRSILMAAICGGLLCCTLNSHAQRGGAARADDVVRGPVFSATIRGPRTEEAIAMKGIVVTVGSDKKAYLCYDTDLMRVAMGWTGNFLNFGNTQYQIQWPPPPQVSGTPVFSLGQVPGWSMNGSLADPRLNQQGPLPKDWAHHKGFYVNGDQVVFKYTVGKTEVLEMPGYQTDGASGYFTRTFNIAPSKEAVTLAISDNSGGAAAPAMTSGSVRYVVADGGKTAVGLLGGTPDLMLKATADRVVLDIPAHKKMLMVQVLVGRAPEAGAPFASMAKSPAVSTDLAKLCKGGPARWNEPTVTEGVRGADTNAYTVDTITEPVKNPYNIKNFFGGFDFFQDGRAAICTFYGEVWVVSGIDESLKKLTWKRYATGLFQPLGLKIVKDTVYVLGRDQITILRDLNKDGEADYYENFNNDIVVTANYHEFCLDLQTDSKGNFYFAKGAPWEPNVTSPHQGCLFKLPKDGSKLEIIATGFRAPNGMAIGPHDEITVSDNEGHWMPSSKLNWIHKGGFYGMTPTVQHPIKLTLKGTNFTANPSDPNVRKEYNFRGWVKDANDPAAPMPEKYDLPFVWLPKPMDNSSGGQVWASKKWGPLSNQLLFMSYGKCTLFEVMPDGPAGNPDQGAMIQIPLKFTTGLMRGRVNPKDGQVYLAGLKGWQTDAAHDGGFYRVRYTGARATYPIAFHAAKQGVELRFSSKLDEKTAADAGSFSAERWNYRYAGSYGSQEYSVNNPSKVGHDKLNVTSAKLSPDGTSVFLEIDDMKASDTLKIKYSVQTADGATVSQDVYGTVYRLDSLAKK